MSVVTFIFLHGYFVAMCYFCLSVFFFFLMIRRPPRSTLSSSSAASDVYKRQVSTQSTGRVTAIGMPMSREGDDKPVPVKKRKRRYSIQVEGLDRETTQQLLGSNTALPELPAEKEKDKDRDIKASRHRRYSVCFEALDIQDMEKLLQESTVHTNPSVSGLEVSLDMDSSCFAFAGQHDGAESDLGMFLRNPAPALESAREVQIPDPTKRRRRFSMCMDEELISKIRGSVVATEQVPHGSMMLTQAEEAPIVRVMVPSKEPSVIRMAVVEPGSVPQGFTRPPPGLAPRSSVVYAHRLPRAAPKVVTAMPVSGGPAMVARPVPKPMREIATRPVTDLGSCLLYTSPSPRDS
eukprot:TRINITY_DN6251_c0_g1_i4.p1 TRINITY_DN6251_c0_g1~~TRINITY_DN6251_c0_g1_i4.p1  ORF type:complete len:350 (-),score=76.02 TRINITY_DN6251_c0_g1_i4:97-1146(-)